MARSRRSRSKSRHPVKKAACGGVAKKKCTTSPYCTWVKKKGCRRSKVSRKSRVSRKSGCAGRPKRKCAGSCKYVVTKKGSKNYCAKRSYKKRRSTKRRTKRRSSKRRSSKRKACRKGSYRNSKTKRCRKRKSSKGRKRRSSSKGRKRRSSSKGRRGRKRSSKGRKRRSKGRRSSRRSGNPWIKHLKAYHKAHPGISYGEAMKKAKKSYKPVAKGGYYAPAGHGWGFYG